MSKLIEDHLRTITFRYPFIPSLVPVRVHAKVVEGTSSERIQFVVIKRVVLASAKLTIVRKVSNGVMWNVHSHYTLHV